MSVSTPPVSPNDEFTSVAPGDSTVTSAPLTQTSLNDLVLPPAATSLSMDNIPFPSTLASLALPQLSEQLNNLTDFGLQSQTSVNDVQMTTEEGRQIEEIRNFGSPALADYLKSISSTYSNTGRLVRVIRDVMDPRNSYMVQGGGSSLENIDSVGYELSGQGFTLSAYENLYKAGGLAVAVEQIARTNPEIYQMLLGHIIKYSVALLWNFTGESYNAMGNYTIDDPQDISGRDMSYVNSVCITIAKIVSVRNALNIAYIDTHSSLRNDAVGARSLLYFIQETLEKQLKYVSDGNHLMSITDNMKASANPKVAYNVLNQQHQNLKEVLGRKFTDSRYHYENTITYNESSKILGHMYNSQQINTVASAIRAFAAEAGSDAMSMADDIIRAMEGNIPSDTVVQANAMEDHIARIIDNIRETGAFALADYLATVRSRNVDVERLAGKLDDLIDPRNGYTAEGQDNPVTEIGYVEREVRNQKNDPYNILHICGALAVAVNNTAPAAREIYNFLLRMIVRYSTALLWDFTGKTYHWIYRSIDGNGMDYLRAPVEGRESPSNDMKSLCITISKIVATRRALDMIYIVPTSVQMQEIGITTMAKIQQVSSGNNSQLRDNAIFARTILYDLQETLEMQIGYVDGGNKLLTIADDISAFSSISDVILHAYDVLRNQDKNTQVLSSTHSGVVSYKEASELLQTYHFQYVEDAASKIRAFANVIERSVEGIDGSAKRDAENIILTMGGGQVNDLVSAVIECKRLLRVITDVKLTRPTTTTLNDFVLLIPELKKYVLSKALAVDALNDEIFKAPRDTGVVRQFIDSEGYSVEREVDAMIADFTWLYNVSTGLANALQWIKDPDSSTQARGAIPIYKNASIVIAICANLLGSVTANGSKVHRAAQVILVQPDRPLPTTRDFESTATSMAAKYGFAPPTPTTPVQFQSSASYTMQTYAPPAQPSAVTPSAVSPFNVYTMPGGRVMDKATMDSMIFDIGNVLGHRTTNYLDRQEKLKIDIRPLVYKLHYLMDPKNMHVGGSWLEIVEIDVNKLPKLQGSPYEILHTLATTAVNIHNMGGRNSNPVVYEHILGEIIKYASCILWDFTGKTYPSMRADLHSIYGHFQNFGPNSPIAVSDGLYLTLARLAAVNIALDKAYSDGSFAKDATMTKKIIYGIKSTLEKQTREENNGSLLTIVDDISSRANDAGFLGFAYSVLYEQQQNFLRIMDVYYNNPKFTKPGKYRYVEAMSFLRLPTNDWVSNSASIRAYAKIVGQDAPTIADLLIPLMKNNDEPEAPQPPAPAPLPMAPPAPMGPPVPSSVHTPTPGHFMQTSGAPATPGSIVQPFQQTSGAPAAVFSSQWSSTSTPTPTGQYNSKYPPMTSEELRPYMSAMSSGSIPGLTPQEIQRCKQDAAMMMNMGKSLAQSKGSGSGELNDLRYLGKFTYERFKRQGVLNMIASTGFYDEQMNTFPTDQLQEILQEVEIRRAFYDYGTVLLGQPHSAPQLNGYIQMDTHNMIQYAVEMSNRTPAVKSWAMEGLRRMSEKSYGIVSKYFN